MARRKKITNEGVRVKGCFRVNIVDPDGTIKGDSGWCDNLMTNAGHLNLLINNMLTCLTSARLFGEYISLGTGTIPASNESTLNGQMITRYMAVTNNTASTIRAASDGTSTLQMTATFTSDYISASGNVRNIGFVWAVNTSTAAGTLLCGNTFTSSQWNTNQSVNVTYQIRFSG